MGRRSKKNRGPAIVQGVFADNLRRLRDQKHEKLRSERARNEVLARQADTSISQIQRLLALELAPGIDLVERLAFALDVRPQDMLTPYFGVQPDTTLPASTDIAPRPRRPIVVGLLDRDQ